MCVGCGIFFFFQAEDGIRDLTVTGVQTCALPISAGAQGQSAERERLGDRAPDCGGRGGLRQEIGRASWRGRGEISVGAGSLKKKKKKKNYNGTAAPITSRKRQNESTSNCKRKHIE